MPYAKIYFHQLNDMIYKRTAIDITWVVCVGLCWTCSTSMLLCCILYVSEILINKESIFLNLYDTRFIYLYGFSKNKNCQYYYHVLRVSREKMILDINLTLEKLFELESNQHFLWRWYAKYTQIIIFSPEYCFH